MYTLFIVIFGGIIIAVALVTPMRLQFTHFVHRNPHVCAVIGAFAVYLVLTGPVHFTFMADDWRHLAAAEQLSDLYADRFSRWVPRVPVWSIFAWIIFYFHIFERSWAPMYLVYAAHASAVALIARWLLRELDDKQDILSTNAWITAFAIGVGALYPNVYEILYWPTCMPRGRRLIRSCRALRQDENCLRHVCRVGVPDVRDVLIARLGADGPACIAQQVASRT